MPISKLVFAAVRNTCGLFVYVGLVAALMANANRIFGNKPNYLAVAAFLMLFVLSALITGLLVLGQPVWLYLQGKRSASLMLLGMTIAAMFVGTLFTLAILAL